MEKNDMMHSPFLRGVLKWCIMIKLLWIVIVASVLQVSAGTNLTYSQTARLNLKLNNVDLEQVIWSIKNQTEFNFFYSTDEVRNVKDLNVNMANVTAQEVLDQCLKGTNLTYEIVHKAVIIKENELQKATFLKEQEAMQQNSSVKGKVTDVAGQPLPGVTITVVGTSRGVITDNDGSFKIDAKSTDKLVFSFIGMESQIVDVKNQKEINVQLKDKTEELEEFYCSCFWKTKEGKCYWVYYHH